MKIKLSKSQWEGINKKDSFIRKSNTNTDDIVIRKYISEKAKMLKAISLAIPCLEDWVESTGRGEVYQRDMEALTALRNVVQEVDPKRYIRDTFRF